MGSGAAGSGGDGLAKRRFFAIGLKRRINSGFWKGDTAEDVVFENAGFLLVSQSRV